MKYEAGTLYSNSLKPVTATERENEFGDTIFFNSGTDSECVVIGGQLYAASIAGRVHASRARDHAQELMERLEELLEYEPARQLGAVSKRAIQALAEARG